VHRSSGHLEGRARPRRVIERVHRFGRARPGDLGRTGRWGGVSCRHRSLVMHLGNQQTWQQRAALACGRTINRHSNSELIQMQGIKRAGALGGAPAAV